MVNKFACDLCIFLCRVSGCYCISPSFVSLLVFNKGLLSRYQIPMRAKYTYTFSVLFFLRSFCSHEYRTYHRPSLAIHGWTHQRGMLLLGEFLLATLSVILMWGIVRLFLFHALPLVTKCCFLLIASSVWKTFFHTTIFGTMY